MIETRSKLLPGKRGTLGLLEKYGDRLVCVRYRYDKESSKRYTTAEIIVDEGILKPRRKDMNRIVHVRIDFDEIKLRDAAKTAGAAWDKQRKLWKMPRSTASKLGLEIRVVNEE